jgi:hypothetical protein
MICGEKMALAYAVSHEFPKLPSRSPVFAIHGYAARTTEFSLDEVRFQAKYERKAEFAQPFYSGSQGLTNITSRNAGIPPVFVVRESPRQGTKGFSV